MPILLKLLKKKMQRKEHLPNSFSPPSPPIPKPGKDITHKNCRPVSLMKGSPGDTSGK